MPHEAQTFVPTYMKSPAQTAAEVKNFDTAAATQYARSYRSATRQYEARVGQPDGYLPVLSNLSPATKVAGAAAFTLTVTGSNFVKASQINWGGQYLTTTYVSPTQLTADIPASLVQSAATVPVKVYTDGSVSATQNFTITATARETTDKKSKKK